jgi:PucR family transcriptional regulator, purine catabolism regulatory protein
VAAQNLIFDSKKIHTPYLQRDAVHLGGKCELIYLALEKREYACCGDWGKGCSMAVKLREVMELPNLSEVKLVAGAEGLDRIVFSSHVVDLPDVSNWVQGGELLFITGIGIQSHLDYLPNIVRECFEKSVAGLVINVGPYISQTPKEVIILANQRGFPVFELPWEVKVGALTRAIHNLIALRQIGARSEQDILETILYGDTVNNDTFAIRAEACQCDLTQFHRVVVIKFEQLTAYLSAARELSEQQALVVKQRMENAVIGIVERFNTKILHLFRLDTLILFLPSLHIGRKKVDIKELADEVLAKFKRDFPELRLNIGWGLEYNDVRNARESLLQAEQSLRVAKGISEANQCLGFNDLGFYKVLFNVKERNVLESFSNEVLHPLLEYDTKHGAELVNTLAVYLELNGNNSQVSSRLHIHKNTLKYRLDKITEILDKNLTNPQDHNLLYFATVVHKFLLV